MSDFENSLIENLFNETKKNGENFNLTTKTPTKKRNREIKNIETYFKKTTKKDLELMLTTLNQKLKCYEMFLDDVKRNYYLGIEKFKEFEIYLNNERNKK